MYISVKRLAVFSFILSVFSVVATVLLFFYFSNGEFNFTEQFTWILYTVTVSVGSLFLSWALFSLSKDLDREYSSNSEYMHKLNKRIKALEDREF